MNADEVGFRIVDETDSFDVGVTKEQGLADPMHSMHHTAVGLEDDPIDKVAIEHAASTLDNISTGQRFRSRVGPPYGSSISRM